MWFCIFVTHNQQLLQPVVHRSSCAEEMTITSANRHCKVHKMCKRMNLRGNISQEFLHYRRWRNGRVWTINSSSWRTVLNPKGLFCKDVTEELQRWIYCQTDELLTEDCFRILNVSNDRCLYLLWGNHSKRGLCFIFITERVELLNN